MKRLITLALLAVAVILPASAQNYHESRYYNHCSGRLDYGYKNSNWFDTGEMYYGLRIGPSFSKVNSDDAELDGGNWQTGLNIAVVMGIPLTPEIRGQEEDDIRPELPRDTHRAEICLRR